MTTTYVALLRAVNVGGTGRMPMSDLRDLCGPCGFRRPRTYIASGNLVFEADGDAASVQARLGEALQDYAGKAIGVLLRTAGEIASILAANPYPDCPPSFVHALCLDTAPPKDLLAGAAGHAGEQIAPGLREIYIFYPAGQGASKLTLPAARSGTARNMNTIAALSRLAQA